MESRVKQIWACRQFEFRPFRGPSLNAVPVRLLEVTCLASGPAMAGRIWLGSGAE